jgi:CheY-like chemotaxis protein
MAAAMEFADRPLCTCLMTRCCYGFLSARAIAGNINRCTKRSCSRRERRIWPARPSCAARWDLEIQRAPHGKNPAAVDGSSGGDRNCGQRAHVSDGEEAINYLRGAGPYSDRIEYPFPCLLITDLMMPKVSGFDVLAWLQSQPQFFASYPLNLPANLLPQRLQSSGYYFTKNSLVLFQPVIQEGKPIGTLFLRASLSGLFNRLWR